MHALTLGSSKILKFSFLAFKKHYTNSISLVTSRVYTIDFSQTNSNDERPILLTVIRDDELSVLTQYLFQSESNSFLSREDLKYDMSRE